MMKKTLLAMALFLTSGAASAATGEFCMFNSDGSINNNLGNWSGLDCDPGITATIVTPPSGVGNSISSSNSFYGIFWNAHDITTYGPGDYSVDTIEGGIYNFTVGPGQIGVHMLFDWNTSTNIDVVNIWDITENPDSVTFTSTDWDGDGILGGAMIDGPFSGFSANFNLSGVDLDFTAPSITLNGGADTAEAGEVYADALGATASDTVDGDITADIVVDTSAVDTSVLGGTYQVTYNVSDTNGNAATQVTRDVTIIDTTIPVITMTGSANVTVEAGDAYSDAGATANDSFEGDLTGSIITVNPVNNLVPGPYTVSYDVNDSTGNSATTVNRTVTVVDTTPPTVTLNGSSTINISLNNAYTELGATANDIVDGYLGAITPTGSVDTTTLGTYILTYSATDTAGNSGSTTRTISVISGNPPSITLLGNASVTIDQNTTYLDAGATATDTEDGDLTGSIVTVNPVNTSTPGIYTVTYNVTDSSGNNAFEVTRTVTVRDAIAPVIIINGNSVVDINQHDSYADAGATATDNIDATVTVNSSGSVNTSVAGSYTITYTATDNAGNAATPVTRTVNVVADTNIPVITLIGQATVNIDEDTSYSDAGATAFDTENGDISPNIVVTGLVTVAEPGTYTLRYNVADAAGNNATEVTRTVIVADVTAPVITLNGNAQTEVDQFTNYSDLGATATDNADSNVTVSSTGTVDTNTAGTYTITYSASDNAGNAATDVTRTVVVIDRAPPVITLNGNSTVSVNVGDTYTPEGATATDNFDTSLPPVTEDCSSVDTTTIGTYTCTYTVTDANTNTATVNRTIFVLDSNITVAAQEPVLTASQGTSTRVIVTTSGNVSVSTDFNTPGDTYDWSATDNNLVPVDTVYDGATFTFDPSALTAGVYQVSVTVQANTADEATGTLLLTVVETAPVLAADVDTDGDGVFDSAEGLGDSDNDGIPDFADDSTLAATQLAATSGTMTSSSGTLRLGSTAFVSGDLNTGDITPEISAADIIAHGGSAGGTTTNGEDTTADATCVGGCFDFEVSNLAPGDVTQIVIPLSAGIPQNAVYRLYTTAAGWHDFAVGGNDAIASSATINGSCPAANASGAWIDGLFPGDNCIRLTIQDGSANDADQLANGTVRDPGGVAEVTPVNTVNVADNSQSVGCSMTTNTINPLHRSDWLLLLGFIALLGMRRLAK